MSARTRLRTIRHAHGAPDGARRPDTARVTTYDDTDLFGQIEDPPPGGRSSRPVRAGRVLVVAAALVVAGVAWLLLANGGGDDAQDATMTVAILDRAQESTDELDPDDLTLTGVDPLTTRFAVRTEAGRHFVALRGDGSLCVVQVPDGDTTQFMCAAASPTATVTVTAEDGSQVLVGADGAQAPPADEGWREAGSNVWVADAPAPTP